MTSQKIRTSLETRWSTCVSNYCHTWWFNIWCWTIDFTVVWLVNRHCQLKGGMLHWLDPFASRFRVKEHMIKERSGCYTSYGNRICIRFVLFLIHWSIRAYLLSGIVLLPACKTKRSVNKSLMPFTPEKFFNVHTTWLTAYFTEISLPMLFVLSIGRYHICGRMSIERLPCYFFSFKKWNCFFDRTSLSSSPSKNFKFYLIFCKPRC